MVDPVIFPSPMEPAVYQPPMGSPTLIHPPLESTFFQPSGSYQPPAGLTQLRGFDTHKERYSGVLVPSPTTTPLTILTPAPSSVSSLFSGSPPPVSSVMSSLPSNMLTPPPEPEPTVWVRPRLGPVPVTDPRTLAEVHGHDWVQRWTKGLCLGEYSRE